jgi:hypothetical protein
MKFKNKLFELIVQKKFEKVFSILWFIVNDEDNKAILVILNYQFHELDEKGLTTSVIYPNEMKKTWTDFIERLILFINERIENEIIQADQTLLHHIYSDKFVTEEKRNEFDQNDAAFGFSWLIGEPIHEQHKEISFDMLKNCLEQSDYQGADIETSSLWLKLYQKGERDWLSSNEIQNLPIVMIYQIDQLWSEYSDGHFGYTTQYRILSSLIDDVKYVDFRTFNKLGIRLGWADERNGFIYDYSRLNFSLGAEIGHLPTTRFMRARIGGGWKTNWEQNCIDLFKKINLFVKYTT